MRMKALCLLVLVPIMAALFCGPSAAQPNELLGGSVVDADGTGALSDWGERAFQPTSNLPGLDQRLMAEYDSNAIRTLGEMHRLFGVQPDDSEPDLGPIITKMLLVAPLLGRSNGFHLLVHPQGDVYTTIVTRIALHALHTVRQVKTPPGTIAMDTHVHTCFSPDSVADVSQVLQTAAHRGLSGVAITDHNTLEGALEAQEMASKLISRHKLPDTFFVIQGEEVSSSDGHIIGLFLSQEIPAGMSAEQTISAIHAQGGIAIAAHPLLPHSLGQLANTEPFDAVETMNGAEELHYALFERGREKERSAFYEAVTRPRIGASDAHDPGTVAVCYTLLNCAPTPDAVRMAILRGQTTAVSSISDEDARSKLRHGLPCVLQLRSVLESYKRATDMGPFLKRITHADDAIFTLWPHPALLWTKRF